jgi:hypothetical protein
MYQTDYGAGIAVALSWDVCAEIVTLIAIFFASYTG